MKQNCYKNFLKKVKSKKIKIGIIGLGYVGLPLAHAFVKRGVSVYGFDIDKEKIENINSGKSYISYFRDKEIKKMKKKKFKCFSKFDEIKNVDFIILCLPTPLTNNKTPDMSFITNTMKNISKHLKIGQAISLESTTYPGTCREVLVPYLKNFNIGKDFFLIYSPEREDPGNKKFSILKIPKVLGGYSSLCQKIGSLTYKLLKIKIVKVSSLEVAEFTKLLENIYRSVNIGMINEMKILCNKMKINIFEIIKAAKTKPFGYQPFYPGPGYGGHCIPIDPFLLSWKAKKYNFNTRFIKLSGKINERMPLIIVNKIFDLIKNFNNRVLIIGASYKKNVDDIRESPSLKIMKLLEKRKILFDYLDPFVKEISNSRQYDGKLKSIKFNYSLIKKYSLTVIVTDHDIFDYNQIFNYSKKILDCRGKYAFINSEKILQI